MIGCLKLHRIFRIVSFTEESITKFTLIMIIYRNLAFILLICLSLNIMCLCEDDNDTISRTFRFNEQERPCNYRGQQGVCRRRSDCKQPTRQVCRFSLNPIVCCLDEPEPVITTSTTKRPKTTKATIVKSDPIKESSLNYPGCGLKPDKIQKMSRNSKPRGRRSVLKSDSVYSRLSKRSAFNPRQLFNLPSLPRRDGSVEHVIVGGMEAAPNSWPWMVAIFKETSSRTAKRFLCGASLISRKYVLTAAHCFDGERGNIDPSKFFIMAGSHTTKDGKEYPVQSILIHPNYKQRQYYNDICIIKLAKEVDVDETTFPVCLPTESLRPMINPHNNNVTVTGWGDTSFGGVKSKVLQELTIPIVPLKECNESYSKLALTNFPQGITNLFMCAGVEEGGKDACQGDSGGPLVSELKDESWVQLGVVSFGYGCAQAGFPGVYTRVSKFAKWIQDNTDLGKI